MSRELDDRSPEWLEQIHQGSWQAFEKFYQKHYPMVFRIAFRLMKDTMEAEDICHDVFVEIIKKGDQFDPARGSVASWLAVKTKSRCLDRLRRKKRISLAQSESAVWKNGGQFSTASRFVEDQVIHRETSEMLQRAMERIPEPQREALYGMYFMDNTQKELAHRMDKPLGTIKSLIRYGLKNVRKYVDRVGWMESGSEGKQ